MLGPFQYYIQVLLDIVYPNILYGGILFSWDSRIHPFLTIFSSARSLSEESYLAMSE
jgi:hypothetical protein